MRRLLLLTLPFICVACAPISHTSYIPASVLGASAQGHPANTHAQFNRPTARQLSPSYTAGRPIEETQNISSITTQATHIYPTGYGNSTHVNSTSTHLAPPLRGRKKVSFYGNIGAGSLDIDSSIYGVVGRVGIEEGFFGAEVEAMSGLTKNNEITNFVGPNQGVIQGETSAGVDYTLAAFGVGRVNISPKTRLYLRGGYHKTQIGVSQSATGLRDVNRSEDVNGFAVGAGLEYFTTDKNGWRLDTTGYEYEDFGWAQSVTASYVRRF